MSGPMLGIEGLCSVKGRVIGTVPHGEGMGSGLSGWDKRAVTRGRD